ncbi:MAG: DUF2887 domain-containing protein [Proteobacteria bacterium]|nr:DUF2887 domain-containing protein [Pseudomonadota bacterium]
MTLNSLDEMKTDSLFYRLLQAGPTLAFELAGLSVPKPEGYRFISQEVKPQTLAEHANIAPIVRKVQAHRKPACRRHRLAGIAGNHPSL